MTADKALLSGALLSYLLWGQRKISNTTNNIDEQCKKRKERGFNTMTIAEILKANGIEDNIITKIQDEMKANKIFTASEENLDIRYGKLKTQHEGKLAELTEAQKLIEEMKGSTKGNEELQGKVSAYEQQIAQLQEELKATQLDAEANTALLAAGVKPDDIDYVKFKLKAKGELELGEDGHIKGMEDKIAALKTQLPGQFENANAKKYEERKLPTDENRGDSVSKETFAKMGYQDRLKLFKDNPEAYAELTK